MTPQGQLAQSIQGQMSPVPPFPSTQSVAGTTNVPLLGNAFIQTHVPSFDVDAVMEMYRTLVSGARPSVRLDILKRHRFTPSGRQARIEASLAALNGPQPTTLTIVQCKELIEEIEEEDDD
jgi:hypothetical protein